MKNSPKVLFIDIETSPLIGYAWQTWETNIIEKIEEFHILSVAYKWLDKKINCVALPQFHGFKKDMSDDKELIKIVWNLLNEADIVVAHNGADFDIKKINARFIFNGLTPPSNYKVVDTLKAARKYFQFDGNKLNDLCQYLGLGKKVETGGFELWKGCMRGDEESWSKMIKYNKKDVILLEKLYYRLRPWIDTHPNFNPITDRPDCPACGSKNMHSRGPQLLTGGRTQNRFQCQDCGKWTHGNITKIKQS
jgi:DNA polymerase elongation subunit (family B)